jgi:hypothetical protein
MLLLIGPVSVPEHAEAKQTAASDKNDRVLRTRSDMDSSIREEKNRNQAVDSCGVVATVRGQGSNVLV